MTCKSYKIFSSIWAEFSFKLIPILEKMRICLSGMDKVQTDKINPASFKAQAFPRRLAAALTGRARSLRLPRRCYLYARLTLLPQLMEREVVEDRPLQDRAQVKGGLISLVCTHVWCAPRGVRLPRVTCYWNYPANSGIYLKIFGTNLHGRAEEIYEPGSQDFQPVVFVWALTFASAASLRSFSAKSIFSITPISRFFISSSVMNPFPPSSSVSASFSES